MFKRSRQTFQNHIKKNTRKAFTLVEIMVTVAILSFGIVSIYQALFVSVDVYGYYTRYFSTQDWLNEKLWDLQDELTENDFIEIDEDSGQIIRENKTFNWDIAVSVLDPVQGLYQVQLTLSWLEGGTEVRTSRVAYLLSPKLRSYEDIAG